MTAVERTPVPHDPAFRCSPWTQAQGVDPIGSSPTFDALLLVERPLPWPHDVSEIPELAAASAAPGVRVMAVVPQTDQGADGEVTIVHRRRTGTNHLVGVDHRVPRDEVAGLLATLAADPLADHLGLASVVGEAPPEVLVCGHGRRDACCGRWGTLLHVELAARSTGVRVWRCSHTGGHRFAPTAITLPDGRAWAYVDADLLEGVVHRSGDLHALAAHDRGTTGLDTWAQVVERGVFEHLGWSWLDRGLATSSTDVAADGRSATVTLTWDGGSAIGAVEVTRVLPVLVCGLPPEQATKTSPELALRSLQIA
ncbi:MAG: sucrase ferredoxin [Acidimicrobiales bacterium]